MFSLIGSVGWPAIGNLYIYTNVLFYYINDYETRFNKWENTENHEMHSPAKIEQLTLLFSNLIWKQARSIFKCKLKINPFNMLNVTG